MTLELEVALQCHSAQIVDAGGDADYVFRIELRESSPVGIEILFGDVEGGEEADPVDMVVAEKCAASQISFLDQILSAEPRYPFSKRISVGCPEGVDEGKALLHVGVGV
ncbi:hypothetical protein D9M71_251640 [compost metagenome]